MKIGVVGLGLGYSLSKLLAENHDIVGIDIDPKAWEEPRIDDEMRKFFEMFDKPVRFSTNYELLKDCEFIFIFVNTPLENGRLSDRNVISAVDSASQVNTAAQYVVLSTMPIGGMKRLVESFNLDFVYAPPMVKRHKFLSTFMYPPCGWQLFGARKPPYRLMQIYRELQPNATQFFVSYETAERIKLLTNVMLSVKIVMANAIRDEFGDDAKKICEVIGEDPRIGLDYFSPGGPAAGPCLPRDLIEIENATSNSLKKIVRIINEVNRSYELVR